jgi:sec-independent protein translocase protein TatA
VVVYRALYSAIIVCDGVKATVRQRFIVRSISMFGGSFSILHWVVVLAVVLLLFGGRGKVSAIMGDFGKGLRNFKTGLKGPEGESTDDDAPDAIEEAPRPAKKAAAKKAPAKKAATTKKAAAKKAPAKKKSASKKASAKK